MIWGLSVVVLIPLVILGGGAAALLGTVTTVVRASRRSRLARQVRAPLPGSVTPRPAQGRGAPAELRAVLAGRRAA
ncbi:hypothetical protein NBH00_23905 [Paraconexibacter antarcticus]|uniref:Sensor histidine kinase n=1 Tax=Paraconexibacter antarcticus TaxID=2949664 RepID=A0ABY5DRZ9_9ACTN|nr:hypothetical protein [Paraconexibacter antarcticus]UTI64369.1 hypothetical protein NBH00_23905 [Paraconexibacter antarcticus]